MRVLILNQTFFPDVAATAQHMWDLARFLEQRGHRVTAVTSRNEYGTGRIIGPAFERIGRIEIHRVSGTRFGKTHLAGRLADFASFYAAAAVALWQLPSPEVILALTSPPLIATLAMLRKQLGEHRTKLVYHVMDLYPDAAVAMGIMRFGSTMERTLMHISARALRASDAIIALGRDMNDRLVRRYGVRAEGVHVVTPWADGRELYPLPRSSNALATELGLAGTFNIVYSGNLGLAHDLETITGAIERMKHDAGVRFVFIGGGRRFEQLRRLQTAAGWEHVWLMDYQPRAALNESLNLADVHLLSQLPAFTGVVVPSKLFGIMAVGRPAVMVGPADAECSRIIAESGCGRVVANGDVDGLVDVLRLLRGNPAQRERMGALGRCAFERDHDQAVTCARIEQLLRKVVDG